MSAIQMTCARCGGHYLAGMVGSRPWPAHVCPDGRRPAEPPIYGWPKPERDTANDDAWRRAGLIRDRPPE